MKVMAYSRHQKALPAAAQVAEQEQELDEAYDALQVDLRRVPCKNWHKVGCSSLRDCDVPCWPVTAHVHNAVL